MRSKHIALYDLMFMTITTSLESSCGGHIVYHQSATFSCFAREEWQRTFAKEHLHLQDWKHRDAYL